MTSPTPDRRGRYDRTLSRSQRWQRARLRLLLGLQRAWARHGAALTVRDVLAESGAPRQSFYAHFHDLSDGLRALDAALERSLPTSAPALAALTPRQRLRALLESLLSWAEADLPRLRYALSRRSTEPTQSLLGALITPRLEAALDAAARDGALAPAQQPLVAALLCGAVEGALRATLAAAPAPGPAPAALASGRAARVERLLGLL